MKIKKIKNIARNGLKKLRQFSHIIGKKECPVCKKKVRHFSPLSHDLIKKIKASGFDLDINEFETLNTKEYYCPHCRCSDRDRLYALEIKIMARENKIPPEGSFIEFAPVPALTKKIRELLPGWKITTADLFDKNADDKVDICNMQKEYPDKKFDMFLCSHVLEHVQDDVEALKELFRITKKGGFGILMAPIHKKLEQTREAPDCKTEEERWKLFAQNDHLRLYSIS